MDLEMMMRHDIAEDIGYEIQEADKRLRMLGLLADEVMLSENGRRKENAMQALDAVERLYGIFDIDHSRIPVLNGSGDALRKRLGMAAVVMARSYGHDISTNAGYKRMLRDSEVPGTVKSYVQDMSVCNNEMLYLQAMIDHSRGYPKTVMVDGLIYRFDTLSDEIGMHMSLVDARYRSRLMTYEKIEPGLKDKGLTGLSPVDKAAFDKAASGILEASGHNTAKSAYLDDGLDEHTKRFLHFAENVGAYKDTGMKRKSTRHELGLKNVYADGMCYHLGPNEIFVGRGPLPAQYRK